MNFEFATAQRILFGAGRFPEAASEARAWGRRIFVVTGRNPDRAARMASLLTSAGMVSVAYAIDGEPTTDRVAAGARQAVADACEVVIGFGGGSVIDAAKAIAALAANPGDPLEYLEVIGLGRPLQRPSLPCLAIPTTAGAGAEATRNAVLTSPEHQVKASMRSVWLLPRLALVDPELTLDLPPQITAVTGLDALTQLIEPYVGLKANPITDGFCVEGIRRVAQSLRRAWENGRDLVARSDMALASLLGGLALANAGLGAVHGFAGPIGGMFCAPHGAVCAALLPHAIKANLRALEQRQPSHPVRSRFDELGRLVTGRAQAAAADAVGWIERLCRDLNVPALRQYGMASHDLPRVVEKAARASSMKGNPIVLSSEELTGILLAAL